MDTHKRLLIFYGELGTLIIAELSSNTPLAQSDMIFDHQSQIQSTLVISISKGLNEILRDIRTSTYQS